MNRIALSLVAFAPMLAGAQVGPAWRPFLNIKPDDSRVAVIKALAEDMNPFSRKAIVAALTDPYRPVVVAAADALKADHCSETFHALVAGLPKGSQYEAAHLLGTYQEPRYIRAMGRLLRDDRVEVRRPIALALGLTGSQLAVAPLRAARKDPISSVRGEVYGALERLRPPRG